MALGVAGREQGGERGRRVSVERWLSLLQDGIGHRKCQKCDVCVKKMRYNNDAHAYMSIVHTYATRSHLHQGNEDGAHSGCDLLGGLPQPPGHCAHQLLQTEEGGEGGGGEGGGVNGGVMSGRGGRPPGHWGVRNGGSGLGRKGG